MSRSCASCGGGPCRWEDQAERHAAAQVKAPAVPAPRVALLIRGPAHGYQVRADLLDPHSTGALHVQWPGGAFGRNRVLTYWRRDDQPGGPYPELWDYQP